MADLIDRQAAISDFEWCKSQAIDKDRWQEAIDRINALPSAQPTIYGYNIEHLELIARVLQKENLPPERVTEALTDIGRIVAIVKDEFEETLRRAVQNVERKTER